MSISVPARTILRCIKSRQTICRPTSRQTDNQLLDHVGVILPTTDAVDQMYKDVEPKIQSLGGVVLKQPKQHRDGSYSFYFSDPDGNVIQALYEPTISQSCSGGRLIVGPDPGHRACTTRPASDEHGHFGTNFQLKNTFVWPPGVGCSSRAPKRRGPFPFLAGVAPDVVASLHEAHSLLTALSTRRSAMCFLNGRRSTIRIVPESEDAYAELVNSRPHLRQHIRCGRKPDGNYPMGIWDRSHQSATVTNGGLRIFNSVKRQAIPLDSTSGRWAPSSENSGMLDGTHQTDAIKTIVLTAPRDAQGSSRA